MSIGALSLIDGSSLALAVGEAEAEGFGLGLPLLPARGERLADGLGEADGDGLGKALAAGVAVGEGAGVGVRLGMARGAGASESVGPGAGAAGEAPPGGNLNSCCAKAGPGVSTATSAVAIVFCMFELPRSAISAHLDRSLMFQDVAIMAAEFRRANRRLAHGWG